jgi:flagellar biosynthesis protein FliQ
MTVLLLGIVVLIFTASTHIQGDTLLSVSILAILGVGAVALFRRNIVRIVKLLPRGSRMRRIAIEL